MCNTTRGSLDFFIYFYLIYLIFLLLYCITDYGDELLDLIFDKICQDPAPYCMWILPSLTNQTSQPGVKVQSRAGLRVYIVFRKLLYRC